MNKDKKIQLAAIFFIIFPIYIDLENMDLFINKEYYMHEPAINLPVPLGAFIVSLMFAGYAIMNWKDVLNKESIIYILIIGIFGLLIYNSGTDLKLIYLLQVIGIFMGVHFISKLALKYSGPEYIFAFSSFPLLHLLSIWLGGNYFNLNRIEEYSFLFGYQIYSSLVILPDIYGLLAAVFFILFLYNYLISKKIVAGFFVILTILGVYSGQRVFLLYSIIFIVFHLMYYVYFTQKEKNELIWLVGHIIFFALISLSISSELGVYLIYSGGSMIEILAYYAAMYNWFSFLEPTFGALTKESRLVIYAEAKESLKIFGGSGWSEGGAGAHNIILGIGIAFGKFYAFLYAALISLIFWFKLKDIFLFFFVMTIFWIPNVVNVPATQPIYIIVFSLIFGLLIKLASEIRDVN